MGKTLKRQKKKLQKTLDTNQPGPDSQLQAGHCVVKINSALQYQRWIKALELLKNMLQAKKKPKLGTLMRWIRIADTTGNTVMTQRLYYWMLMVVGWQPMTINDPLLLPTANSKWLWDPLGQIPTTQVPQLDLDFNSFPAPIDIPTGSEIKVRTYPPNSITFSSKNNSSYALSVPFVPGALLLANIFTPTECQQFIWAAENLGFQAGVDYSFNSEFSVDSTLSTARFDAMQSSGSVDRPAEGCFWLVDSSILDQVHQRVLPLLPQVWHQKALTGINARWRFYRYDPGTLYRPHIDGSWPGSGIDSAGQYAFDVFGDQWSCFTFLVYLNDEFEGGCTRFYMPSKSGEQLDTFEVRPRQGCVLVFPHGSLEAALHEGGSVRSGSKYVIRTDVLYKK